MRSLPVEITTYLAQNAGVTIRQLLWVIARNRNTGDYEEIGLWSGEDHVQFIINGQNRTYYGSGQFINFGELTLESTLNVRKMSAKVSAISPEMEVVLRQYDPKMAITQLHLAMYSPISNNLIAPPLLIHKGWIDRFVVKTPALKQQGEGGLDMMGHTRIMTRTLPTKRSHETQIKRASNDTFYKDVTVTGQVSTPWGSKV